MGKASHRGRLLTLAVVSKEERKLWCCIAVSIPGAQAVGQGLHLASQMLQDLQWSYAMKSRLFLQSVLKQLPKEAVKYLKCFVA